MKFSSTSSIAKPQRPSRDWIWILAVAILLIVLGLVAMSSLFISAIAYVVVIGWLLIGGSVVQIGGAFLFRNFGGFAKCLFLSSPGRNFPKRFATRKSADEESSLHCDRILGSAIRD